VLQTARLLAAHIFNIAESAFLPIRPSCQAQVWMFSIHTQSIKENQSVIRLGRGPGLYRSLPQHSIGQFKNVTAWNYLHLPYTNDRVCNNLPQLKGCRLILDSANMRLFCYSDTILIER
jgi:hypothetical protein